jgi:hypothetical protein
MACSVAVNVAAAATATTTSTHPYEEQGGDEEKNHLFPSTQRVL